jgi:hypothetical protein
MKMRVWQGQLVIAVAIVSGLLPFLSALRADVPQTPPQVNAEPHDAFADADMEFMSLYSSGRLATLAKLDPLIVVEMNSLVLIHGGHRTEANVIPPLYHRLKAVSHIPLAIYVALAPYGNVPLDEDRLSRLRTFKARVAAVLPSLERSGFNAEQIQRSRTVLERCRTFLDEVLSVRKYEPADLKALTRAAGPIVLACASDAARAEIDAYHAQVTAWRRDLRPDEWSRLRVVVLGKQMPRKHNVATQYFAKLLGDPDESRRLVYAEELSGEQQGLNLLATHQLDSELSEAFFDDPDRMEIELLGNAASVYLDGFDFQR